MWPPKLVVPGRFDEGCKGITALFASRRSSLTVDVSKKSSVLSVPSEVQGIEENPLHFIHSFIFENIEEEPHALYAMPGISVSLQGRALTPPLTDHLTQLHPLSVNKLIEDEMSLDGSIFGYLFTGFLVEVSQRCGKFAGCVSQNHMHPHRAMSCFDGIGIGFNNSFFDKSCALLIEGEGLIGNLCITGNFSPPAKGHDHKAIGVD